MQSNSASLEKELDIYKKRSIKSISIPPSQKSLNSIGIQATIKTSHTNSTIFLDSCLQFPNSINSFLGNLSNSTIEHNFLKIKKKFHEINDRDLSTFKLEKENIALNFEKLNSENSSLKQKYQNLLFKYEETAKKLIIQEESCKKIEESYSKLYIENLELKQKRELAIKELTNHNFRQKSAVSLHDTKNQKFHYISTQNTDSPFNAQSQFKFELELIYKEFVSIIFSDNLQNLIPPNIFQKLIDLEKKINTVLSKIKDYIEDVSSSYSKDQFNDAELNNKLQLNEKHNKSFVNLKHERDYAKHIFNDEYFTNPLSIIEGNGLIKNGPIKVNNSTIQYSNKKRK